MSVMMVLLNYSLRIIGFLLPNPNAVQSRWLSSCLCPPGPWLLLGDFLDWCHPPWSLLGSWRESIKTFRPLLDGSPVRPAGHPGRQKLPRQFAGPDWSGIAPALLPVREFYFLENVNYDSLFRSHFFCYFFPLIVWNIDGGVMNETNGWMMWKQF